MTTIKHEYSANCPPEALWAVLRDLTAVARYNPQVKSARISGRKVSGVGAMRSCDLEPKGRVVERVTDYDEGRELGLEVVESDWPITFMKWVTRIEPDGSGARLTQSLDYGMKFGPVGWLLDTLMMRRAITRNIGRALEGLIAEAEAMQ